MKEHIQLFQLKEMPYHHEPTIACLLLKYIKYKSELLNKGLRGYNRKSFGMARRKFYYRQQKFMNICVPPKGNLGKFKVTNCDILNSFLGSSLDPNPRKSFKVEIVKANISRDDCGAKII